MIQFFSGRRGNGEFVYNTKINTRFERIIFFPFGISMVVEVVTIVLSWLATDFQYPVKNIKY